MSLSRECNLRPIYFPEIMFIYRNYRLYVAVEDLLFLNVQWTLYYKSIAKIIIIIIILKPSSIIHIRAMSEILCLGNLLKLKPPHSEAEHWGILL